MTVWTDYVKKYAKDNNLSYKESMKKAAVSYNKIKMEKICRGVSVAKAEIKQEQAKAKAKPQAKAKGKAKAKEFKDQSNLFSLPTKGAKGGGYKPRNISQAELDYLEREKKKGKSQGYLNDLYKMFK
tara:strand:- start:526 stop:906 length:381 start_codon:yes stop_codon:yes gene_type:complete